MTRAVVLMVFVMSLVSCVTVNVNFPESAVQKATDDYVRELYQAKEKLPAAKQEKKTLLKFELISSAVAADELMFKVDTPKALKIRESLASRVDDVLAQKRSGALGETQDGWLVVREPEKVKPLLVKKLEKIVKEENADRTELYAEVLSANALPTNRIVDIQKSFGRSFQAQSPSGTWIENAEQSWSKKP